MIMHAGCDISFSLFFNDTWSFSLSTHTWRQLHTSGQAPSSCGHGASVVENRMYVFGGLTAGDISNHLDVLDLNTLKWFSLSSRSGAFTSSTHPWPPPRALIQHSMVSLSSKSIAVVSGISDSKNNDDDATWIFQTDTLKWSKGSSGQLGQTNVGGSSAVATMDGTIIVSGGFRSDFPLTNATLDMLGLLRTPNSESFSPLPAENTPHLAFHASLLVNSGGALAPSKHEQLNQGLNPQCLVTIGGFNSSAVSPAVWILRSPLTGQLPNVDNNVGKTEAAVPRWQALQMPHGAAVPPPHFAFGLVHDRPGGFAYIYGGRIHPEGHHEELATDIWRLDLSKACP